jgi:3-dehydroquinate dehydratase/shikimate dehydrogenase
MTLLVTSAFVENTGQIAAVADRAFREGADAVELRLDAFEGDAAEIAECIKTHSNRTWIVTCRSAEEGGLFRGDTMERVSRLIAAARGTGAYVDFELSDWRRSSNIRQKVLLAAEQPAGNHRLILSHHDFSGVPSDSRAIVKEVHDAGAGAIAKIAYRCDHINESFAALDLMHEFADRVIAVAMGEDGAWTRMLAKKLGAFASYAALDAQAGTAPGQATIAEMVRLRWRKTGRHSKVFGVLGDPVFHSMSPALFNRWFEEAGIDALYLPLRVRGAAAEFESFAKSCAERAWLGVAGFSVTVPHKPAALNWVGDGADSLSQRIGAVNTVVFRDGVRGHNTDCYAAVGSLAQALDCATVDLSGLEVDLLGAGGVARALVEGLHDVGARVTVYARSQSARERLARQHGCSTRSWEERVCRSEVLINCTPIGMWPQVDESPMPAEALRGCRLVFDLIYNPLQTKLLREATVAGCAALNGLDMFIRQAATQFELWTGQTPDRYKATRFLERAASPLGKGGSRGVACLALIGMRGSGKTTVGRELGRLLGGTHVDTDEVIVQRAGRSIADIFATEGEAGFRRRESDVLREVLQSPPDVVSVGGGAVLDPDHVRLLRVAAEVVWLTASPDVLWQRIYNDPKTRQSRPALTGLAEVEELRQILQERRSLYERAADAVIDTTDRSPAQLAQDILKAIGARSGSGVC